MVNSKSHPNSQKGLKCDIQNYRPIANLCPSSKLFEILILKHILHIETLKGIDLTGIQQYGFKCKKVHPPFPSRSNP